MRQHYSLDSLDRLAEYGTEPVPDPVQVVNPVWRQLDSQIRTLGQRRSRQLALFGASELAGALEEADVARFEQRKAQLQEEIESLGRDIDRLKAQRKQTPHHVAVRDLPESDRFSRLLTERKHFIDTVKLIAYRAETSMASLLREKLLRPQTVAPITAAPLRSVTHPRILPGTPAQRDTNNARIGTRKRDMTLLCWPVLTVGGKLPRPEHTRASLCGSLFCD